jgi:hypothetical protein
MESELRRIGLWQLCDVDDKELASLKKSIEQKGSRDIDVWVKAGMPRAELLHFLASVPLESEACIVAILDEMRKRQASLKSLGQRVKTITREANSLLETSSSRVNWWFCLHGGGLAIGTPPPNPLKELADLSETLSGMEALSEMLDNEQRLFGTYLRASGRVQPAIVQLLLNCWARRSKRRRQLGEKNPRRFQLDHLDALARLLTDAFECAGKKTHSPHPCCVKCLSDTRSDYSNSFLQPAKTPHS